MKSVSGKELAKAVEKQGWRLMRVRGSHHIFVKSGRRERIVIPIHGDRPLKRGLQRRLMRIAGLEEDDL